MNQARAAAKKQFHKDYNVRFREDQAAMVNDTSTAHAERRTAVAATRYAVCPCVLRRGDAVMLHFSVASDLLVSAHQCAPSSYFCCRSSASVALLP